MYSSVYDPLRKSVLYSNCLRPCILLDKPEMSVSVVKESA